MELRHLRYFVALAEELHFGRAAQRLHIVQPALSKQVIALERELGFDLFDRSHGVSLTSAGTAFYEDSRAILERLASAVGSSRAIARGELGNLDVGYITPAMWSVLPPTLREHRRAHPQLRYRLVELGSTEQMERLRARTLDIGFVRPLVLDDVLTFEPVWRERFVVGMADDHRLAGAEEIDLAELKEESFVVLPRANAPVLNDLHLSICLGYGFSPRVVEEANSPSALVMVAMGLCVALVPESVQDAGFKGIAFRPLTRPTPELDLTVAYRRDSCLPTAHAFLETLRATIPLVKAHGRAPCEPPAGPSSRGLSEGSPRS